MADHRPTGGAGVPDPDVAADARVTWDAVLEWRMERHHLTSRSPPEELVDVVSDVCGVHAQLTSSAVLSLGARVRDLRRSTVEDALWVDRSLVKTWSVRGTLRLLPAREYAVWQAFVDHPRGYEKASWLRYFGFTADELERVLEAISAALADDVLTREELAARVGRITEAPELGDKLTDNWGATLKPAAFQGRLCHAPSDGRRVRFVRPDRWIGDWERVAPELALSEITRRYLAAYGPVTRDQYARWAGITDAAAGRRIERLEDDVCLVELEDGSRGWLLSDDVDAVATVPETKTVRLLPRFDPYVVGGPREEPAILPPERAGDVFRSNGWIAAVLLVDGRIEGVWDYDHADDRLSVRIEPFDEPDARVREAAEREARTVAETLDSELTLSWDR